MSKMLLVNQIAEFLKPLYLKYELMNQLDFWYTDVDSRNRKDGLQIQVKFRCVGEIALNPLDCRIYKAALSQEQLGQSA